MLSFVNEKLLHIETLVWLNVLSLGNTRLDLHKSWYTRLDSQKIESTRFDSNRTWFTRLVPFALLCIPLKTDKKVSIFTLHLNLHKIYQLV